MDEEGNTQDSVGSNSNSSSHITSTAYFSTKNSLCHESLNDSNFCNTDDLPLNSCNPGIERNESEENVNDGLYENVGKLSNKNFLVNSKIF